MSHRGDTALSDREIGRASLAVAAAQARHGLATARDRAGSILVRIAAGLAQTRAAAGALRDLSSVEDDVLRDIGLNRALIDRSDYRLTPRLGSRHGVRQ